LYFVICNFVPVTSGLFYVARGPKMLCTTDSAVVARGDRTARRSNFRV